MDLTKEQEEILILTMELDLKAKEYKMLCDEFEKFKNERENLNLEILLNLKDKFLQNQKEIREINEKLKSFQNK